MVLGAGSLGTCADSGYALPQLHGISRHVEHAGAASSVRFRAAHEAQADFVDDRGGGRSRADLSHANRFGRLFHAYYGRVDFFVSLRIERNLCAQVATCECWGHLHCGDVLRDARAVLSRRREARIFSRFRESIHQLDRYGALSRFPGNGEADLAPARTDAGYRNSPDLNGTHPDADTKAEEPRCG